MKSKCKCTSFSRTLSLSPCEHVWVCKNWCQMIAIAIAIAIDFDAFRLMFDQHFDRTVFYFPCYTFDSIRFELTVANTGRQIEEKKSSNQNAAIKHTKYAVRKDFWKSFWNTFSSNRTRNHSSVCVCECVFVSLCHLLSFFFRDEWTKKTCIVNVDAWWNIFFI